MGLIVLREGNIEAKILDNRQMVSLTKDGHEFMHRGGNPEFADERAIWPYSEFLMGPIVGPAADNEVEIGGKKYKLDRHGFLRHVTYDRMMPEGLSIGYQDGGSAAAFAYKYLAGTPVKSTTDNQVFSFPHSFSIERHYELDRLGILLTFSVTNDSDEDMPFEIGWHPGFKAPDREGRFDLSINGERLKFADIGGAGSDVRLYSLDETARASRFYSGDRHVEVFTDLPDRIIWRKPGTSIYGDEPVRRLPRPDMKHFIDVPKIPARGLEEYFVRLDL
jgi:galactose mutarotase-like enzyme